MTALGEQERAIGTRFHPIKRPAQLRLGGFVIERQKSEPIHPDGDGETAVGLRRQRRQRRQMHDGRPGSVVSPPCENAAQPKAMQFLTNLLRILARGIARGEARVDCRVGQKRRNALQPLMLAQRPGCELMPGRVDQ